MPSKNTRTHNPDNSDNPAKTGVAGTTGPTGGGAKPPIPGRGPGNEGPADEKTGHGKTPEIGARDGGREQQDGPPHHDEPGRGSSIQGKHQDAKGGPMGANQGGAPRGGSRVEPSHVNDQRKQDKRQTRDRDRGPAGRED